jgi:hypothetical protein
MVTTAKSRLNLNSQQTNKTIDLWQGGFQALKQGHYDNFMVK